MVSKNICTIYPGIYLCFFFYKAWVKVDIPVNNNISLVEYAQTYNSKNTKLINILNEYKDCNNFIHSIHAVDPARMLMILDNGLRSKLNVNIADYSYVYTWYRPINRNLPKYLLECALDTKSCDVIEILLDLNCDVNLPHSSNCDPFFFYAFNENFSKIKEKFLKNANFESRNQKGHNILFHLVFTYLKSVDSPADVLISDFKMILNKYPYLVYQRDQDGCTLVETIKCMSPNQYKNGIRFIRIINRFIFKSIFQEKNVDLFLEYIYNGYGLILTNTKFDEQEGCDGTVEETGDITVEKYIEENDVKEFKKHFKVYFNSNFVNILSNFYKFIKTGDLYRLKQTILADSLSENLVLFNDYGGRSCLHIAVLYSHIGIVK
jgi:hypothetical protein